MAEPSVAVVILNWNGQALLEQFLPGVMKSLYPNLQIVVGDNASTDDSVSYVRENYPEVTIIENEKNFGFAEGYRKLLDQVNADYYILLNSDVEVPPDWIMPVIRMMEADTQIAAAQPKIKWQKDKSSFEYAGAAGGYLDLHAFPFCRGRLFDTVELDNGQYDDAQEIFWASGAALFIRSECWRLSGGLDPDFFAHMEEIDLCWRLKNMGYKIMYCPDAEVYHVGGGTLNANNPYKTYLNFRNNLIIMQKNLPLTDAWFRIFIRIWIDFVAWIHFLIQGKTVFAMAISKAHYHFFKYLTVNGRKRGKVQRRFSSLSGQYNSSIVYDYFGRKLKYFSELKW
ncbi:b-glycosyltransferase, glycosyltransferase family 2 protein [Pedobacter sp. BAL39]|uniref:glycosyltransferase family 2 protein n=1 Tax=Pedobacter sp. BAL39 TaxID=391596 RepID=UPI0001559EB2|nr:glycosyltransferase family 2 protein [Pedobacter sp. BAL39]EDM38392.1 b-glycosyltransferase, glycosyltransferase family 2 protein [Pedobacter sp. BAL39]